ncbi:hypothetical protein BD560DRAFT_473978 [Blakeslea trispora]|nr:hypothetical protein BD560DRAFT_473978 [Blakeslea trispora]
MVRFLATIAPVHIATTISSLPKMLMIPLAFRKKCQFRSPSLILNEGFKGSFVWNPKQHTAVTWSISYSNCYFILQYQNSIELRYKFMIIFVQTENYTFGLT